MDGLIRALDCDILAARHVCVTIRWFDRALLKPHPLRCELHPPPGRVEGEVRAFGEGGWRLDRCSNHPPRKLAYARFPTLPRGG